LSFLPYERDIPQKDNDRVRQFFVEYRLASFRQKLEPYLLDFIAVSLRDRLKDEFGPMQPLPREARSLFGVDEDSALHLSAAHRAIESAGDTALWEELRELKRDAYFADTNRSLELEAKKSLLQSSPPGGGPEEGISTHLTIGSRVQHPSRGFGTVVMVELESVVVAYEDEGDIHTYRQKSWHKLSHVDRGTGAPLLLEMILIQAAALERKANLKQLLAFKSQLESADEWWTFQRYCAPNFRVCPRLPCPLHQHFCVLDTPGSTPLCTPSTPISMPRCTHLHTPHL
jgi:hypothetical protein